MTLKLYDYWRSSASYRVRIALHLKGLEFETIPVHLVQDGGWQKTAEYIKLNPQQLVPTLVHNGQAISQSLAIIEYLDECFEGPLLLPKEPLPRAHARKIAMAIAMDIHPLNNLRVLQYLTQELGADEGQKSQWYQHWVTLTFNAIESWVDPNGLFCLGDQPSIADLCLIPQLYNAHRFAIPLEAYPNLRRIERHCLAQPTFKKALPVQPEDNSNLR